MKKVIRGSLILISTLCGAMNSPVSLEDLSRAVFEKAGIAACPSLSLSAKQCALNELNNFFKEQMILVEQGGVDGRRAAALINSFHRASQARLPDELRRLCWSIFAHDVLESTPDSSDRAALIKRSKKELKESYSCCSIS